MSLYNLSLPAGADPFDMDSYSKTPEVSKAASQEMGLSNILWVEGTSDVNAIKHLLKYPSNLAVHSVNAGPHELSKNKVFESFEKYTPVPNQPQEFFSVDRDMDNLLEEVLRQDPNHRLFYQMCEQNRTGGYNDLECFLYDSSLLDDLLVSEFGICGTDVDDIRGKIFWMAAYLGSLRIGSRLVKKRRKDAGDFSSCKVLDYRCLAKDPF